MKLPRQVTCSEVGRREVLKALIMHELSEDDENRVLDHLRNCPKCLSEMAVIICQTVIVYPNGCDIRSTE